MPSNKRASNLRERNHTLSDSLKLFQRTIAVFACLFTGIAVSWVAYAQTTIYENAYSAYLKHNYGEAEAIWEHLSEVGDANAQYALGVMNQRGEAKSPSPQAAYNWFIKAAEQQNIAAMFNVGVAYWKGDGIDQDRDKALEWWHLSAELGDSGAQYNLGLAYYIGEAVKQEPISAKKWLTLAAAQQHPQAKKVIKLIEDGNTGRTESKRFVSTKTSTKPIKDEEVVMFKNKTGNEPKSETNLAMSIGTIKKEQKNSQKSDNPALTKNREELANSSNDIEHTLSQASNIFLSGKLPESSSESINAKLDQVTVNTDSNATNHETNIQEFIKTTFKYWKIGAAKSPLYTGPSTYNQKITYLPENAPIEIIRQQGNWAYVTLPDGLLVWIYDKYIDIDIDGDFGTVNAALVRARSNSSISSVKSPPVGKFLKGDRLRIVEILPKWVRVRAPKHLGGWVQKNQLEAYKDTKENRDRDWREMVAKGI